MNHLQNYTKIVQGDQFYYHHNLEVYFTHQHITFIKVTPPIQGKKYQISHKF